MKQKIVVLLLIAICCSACSSLSSGAIQDAPKVSSSSSDQLSETNSAASFSIDVNEFLSYMKENHMNYDFETLERRYAYFMSAPQE